jgi:hypothetical protein
MPEVKFTPLRESEPLEDFFTRLESYFERKKVSESNKLGHLSNAIANDRIWETVETQLCRRRVSNS